MVTYQKLVKIYQVTVNRGDLPRRNGAPTAAGCLKTLPHPKASIAFRARPGTIVAHEEALHAPDENAGTEDASYIPRNTTI